MAHRQSTPPAQRISVLTAVLALHLLLIALVLWTRGLGAPAPTPVKAGIVSVFSVPAEQPATLPPPPVLPSKIAEVAKPLADLIVAPEYDATATALPAGGCSTVEWVAKALLADAKAIDAVTRAPPETRSVADAIVVWNAGWSPGAQTIDSPLGPVRAVAEQSLLSIEEGCLDEQIAGPRLIPIPVGERTTFVVFGSGNWTWRELIADTNRTRRPLSPLLKGAGSSVR